MKPEDVASGDRLFEKTEEHVVGFGWYEQERDAALVERARLMKIGRLYCEQIYPGVYFSDSVLLRVGRKLEDEGV